MRLFWLLILIFVPLIQAVLRLKLQHWFPQYESHMIDATASCRQEVDNYLFDNRTDCHSPCACATDCILAHTTDGIIANFGSAQVLLGLMPAILTFVGPTTTEVAALSTYRPLLAVLLSLGSPAINVTRLFRHADVLEPFTRPISRSSALGVAWLNHQNNVFRLSLQVLSYLGALTAIASNVRNSVYTDLRTISAWRCGALFMPMVWSLLALAVHSLGMIAIRIRLRGSYKPAFRSAVRSTAFRRFNAGEESALSEFLFWLASLFAIIHVTFGTLELSSLLFISALEALQVFIMYAASAFLCQFILLLELGNMRYQLSKKPDTGPILGTTPQKPGTDLARACTV